jgi:hypothetical protein
MIEYSLSDLLGEVPDDIFFNDEGHPNFNAIFVEISKRVYGERTNDFSIPSRDFLTGRLPNLSTFQRSVSHERKKRRG